MAATSTPRRLNGEGAVYPVKDGSGYRGTILLPHPVTGKEVRRFVRGTSRADVIGKLNKLRTDPNAAFAAKGTVGEFLTRWLATSKGDIRPATWRQRDYSVRTHMIPAVGAIKLAKLAPGDVERMTAGMVASGSSPTTASTARVILRRALGDALRDGLVARNVAALARPPRKERHELVYLDSAALRRLLDAVADKPFGPIVILAATTGLRRGELLGLQWPDVDLAAASLTVRRSMALAWDGTYQLAEPKTKRSRRTINLPSRAVAALRVQGDRQEALKEAAGRTWQDRDRIVFTDEAGRPLVGDIVSARFERILKLAKLPTVPFHALRHSAASAMLTAGVPLKVVSDTLGHASIAITADTYAHVAPELRRDAADAMDRALGLWRQAKGVYPHATPTGDPPPPLVVPGPGPSEWMCPTCGTVLVRDGALAAEIHVRPVASYDRWYDWPRPSRQRPPGLGGNAGGIRPAALTVMAFRDEAGQLLEHPYTVYVRCAQGRACWARIGPRELGLT